MRFMLNITEIMKKLAEDRPIFHSEADFQFALAWEIQKTMQECQIRLEYPFSDEEKRKYLDIWLLDMKIAIELKYKTRKLEWKPEGSEECFALKGQEAQDVGRYGFIRDIRRLERHGRAAGGFAVLLTNDPLYWEKPSGTTGAQDEDFFLYDGRVIGGAMEWSVTKDWMRKEGVDKPIKLDGCYGLNWQDYSNCGEEKFRYLAVKMPCSKDKGQ